MSKKKLSIALLLTFLLTATCIALALAQPRTVGVFEGEWFRHGEISVNWESNDTSASFPPYGWEWLEEWNETEWMTVTVESISGTNITSEVTQHFNNGSDKIRPGWIAIDSGNSSDYTNDTMDMTFMLISANLDENDTLYTSGDFSSWTINETITRNYPDTIRETNHLNLTWEYSYSNFISVYYYHSMNYYWDRSTGILVEWSMQVINHTGQYLTNWSIFSRITDSSVWVIPEFHHAVSLLFGIIITTAVVISVKRKLVKSPSH
jgi:hypothetical protein